MTYKVNKIMGIVVETMNNGVVLRNELKFDSLHVLLDAQVVTTVVDYMMGDDMKGHTVCLPIEVLKEDGTTEALVLEYLEKGLASLEIKVINKEDATMNNTTTMEGTTMENMGEFEKYWDATVKAILKHAPSKDIKAIIDTPDFMVYDLVMSKVDAVIQKLFIAGKFKEAQDVAVAKTTIKSIVAEIKDKSVWETIKAIAALIFRKTYATTKGIARFTLDTTVILSTMVVRLIAATGCEVYYAGKAIGKSAVTQYNNVKNA